MWCPIVGKGALAISSHVGNQGDANLLRQLELLLLLRNLTSVSHHTFHPLFAAGLRPVFNVVFRGGGGLKGGIPRSRGRGGQDKAVVCRHEAVWHSRSLGPEMADGEERRARGVGAKKLAPTFGP